MGESERSWAKVNNLWERENDLWEKVTVLRTRRPTELKGMETVDSKGVLRRVSSSSAGEKVINRFIPDIKVDVSQSRELAIR